MIAAGCGDDARGRNLPHQQICKRAAGLEGTSVLKVLEFECDGKRTDSEIRAVHINGGRESDVRLDQLVSCCDRVWFYIQHEYRASVVLFSDYEGEYHNY